MTDLLDDESLLELEQRLGRTALIRVLATQLRYGRELIDRLEKTSFTPAAVAVRHAVHQMAGSCGSVGLTKLGVAALQLEQMLATDPVEELRPRILDLCALGQASLDALASRYPEAAPR